MRDTGLKLAIDAAGGVSSLARGLGIAQPSVSSWQRIPAERIVAVEALTGVDRSRLRPDLFVEDASANDLDADASATGACDINGLRAREYLLLAALLRFPVTADLLVKLAGIKGDATPLGLAHMALADAACAADERGAGREFFNLFIGVGRGELLPYGSFYLTGFLNERPLGRVREDLAKLGIERAENNCDPEDHIATLLETMAGLASGEITAEAGADKAFFDRHLKPWAPRFFADLAVAPSARFYRAVAGVGHAFLDLEAEAFELPDNTNPAH